MDNRVGPISSSAVDYLSIRWSGLGLVEGMMVRLILLTWFIANFLFKGIFILLNGRWYLQLPTFEAMGAEVGLIILPNLLLPVLLLRYDWPEKKERLSPALDWIWNGWRPILVGVAAFGIYLMLSTLVSNGLGPGISYNKPGEGGPITGWLGLLALLGYILFVL